MRLGGTGTELERSPCKLLSADETREVGDMGMGIGMVCLLLVSCACGTFDRNGVREMDEVAGEMNVDPFECAWEDPWPGCELGEETVEDAALLDELSLGNGYSKGVDTEDGVV